MSSLMYGCLSLELNDEQESMKQSFQAGVDTIYNKMVSCGETPSSKSPTDIANKIQQMYDGRYSTGYSIGYNEGRTQGQNDVKGNPNGYGLYTQQQYDQNYNNGRTQGQNDVKNNPNNYGLYNKTQYDNHYNNGRTQGQNDVKNNPNGYGLYNKTQYDQNYNNGYNAGKTATKQVTVRTFISSHAWQCYAITYINDKEVCRVDSRNPSDDSTITKSNTATANV